MTYSISRVQEILGVDSAALPNHDWTVVGDDGPDALFGTHNFAIGVTWTDLALIGDAGDDTLDGEEGDDSLYPGPGDDEVLGGPGTDAVAFVDALGPVTVDLGSGYANENGDRDTISDVENVLGSGGADHVYGDDRPNVLDGWDGDDFVYGRGGIDDLRGGEGDDVLDGGADADTILDGEGNDALVGGDGDDTLLADEGDDTLDGGEDDDLIAGGAGIDTASYASATGGVAVSLLLQGKPQNTGGAGWDELSSIANLRGGSHDDWLLGDHSDNTLEGVEGVDHLYGNGGDDLLRGGLGDDTLVGGEGIDRASYFYATGGVTVSLLAGTASGAQGSDTLSGIEEIGGSAYADTLTGDDRDNTLLGAGGDDLLRGGLGNDTLDGGIGSDTPSWWQAPGSVTVDLRTDRATGGAGADTLISVENAIGSDGYGDTLTGDAEVNRLEGWGGDDVLTGGVGADVLDGGAGSDTASYASSAAPVSVNLAGGSAHDSRDWDSLTDIERVIGSPYHDVLLGGAEVNTLDGGYGEDYIEGGPGDDTLIGGYDTDVASYWLTDGSVTVDLAAGTATGVDGADTLSGFEDAHGSDGYGDTLSGDDWANVLKGWAGDDLLRGRGGDDVLEGGDGVDRAIYDDAPGGVNVFLHLGMANGAASSDDLAGIEDLTGSAFDDTLTGDAAANRIEGGDGDDNIYGREGDDLLDGGEGVDTANYWDAPAFVVVDLGSGQAALGGGTDTLTGFENVGGSSFGDQLIGDGSVNEILGSGGVDTIVGQGGADVLTGGADADIFWYDAAADADDDFAVIEEITDFVSRSDVINLSAIDTDAGAPGDQAFTFIGTDAFSATAVDEVRFSAGVIYVDTDNDVGAEMAIALTGVASVTAADFVL